MEEYKQVLKGGRYRMCISNENDTWQYVLMDDKDAIIMQGGEFERYEQLITEMSELSDALRAIFG